MFAFFAAAAPPRYWDHLVNAELAVSARRTLEVPLVGRKRFLRFEGLAGDALLLGPGARVVVVGRSWRSCRRRVSSSAGSGGIRSICPLLFGTKSNPGRPISALSISEAMAGIGGDGIAAPTITPRS